MNKFANILLKKVNEKLRDKPLVYFSKDGERALGLEKYLTNYFIASIEDNYIVDQLSKTKRVFSADRNKINLGVRSTNELVNSDEVAKWILSIKGGDGFYAQLFQFNQPSIFHLNKLGGIVLNNNSKLNRKFEDKLSQFHIFRENQIEVPQSEVHQVLGQDLSDILQKLSFNPRISKEGILFVCQLNRGHTGSGTFFIKNSSDWSEFAKANLGNLVKISEHIVGDAYTINGCVTQKGVFVSGLQYQITGIKELTAGMGSTVGNDFSFARFLKQHLKDEIYETTTRVGEIMSRDGYRGLFGLDFIVTKGKAYLIEINARQTANIPFQTKLELLQGKIPLALINLAEWLDIEIDIEPFEEIEDLEGSQVFLRSKKDNFIVADNIKSGVYRLQSDNSAMIQNHSNVIRIDEEGDKPLIWQHDGYSLEDIEVGGFLLMVQKKGALRQKFDEVARMQFKQGSMINHGNRVILKPWILEAMKEIEERILI